MARKANLGEFEQLVLLAALRLADRAYAPRIAQLLEDRAGRDMSRGTLYAALDRLERRELLTWERDSTRERRKRRFVVTERGLRTLSHSRAVLLDMWSGLEERLERKT